MQPFKQTTNPELLTHHNTDQCEHISQWAVTTLLYQYPHCIRTPLNQTFSLSRSHIKSLTAPPSDLHVTFNQTKIFFRTKFHLNWRHLVYYVDHKAQSASGLYKLIISWTLVSLFILDIEQQKTHTGILWFFISQ